MVRIWGKNETQTWSMAKLITTAMMEDNREPPLKDKNKTSM